MHIRSIRPEDKGLYRDFVAKVAPNDVRLRLFTARPKLSHRFLAQLTQIDYARDPDYTKAEFAILVRSDLKGYGLGWQLMTHLIRYANTEKLQELHGLVLMENASMLKMCRELGFAIDPEPGDASLRHVCLRLV